MTTALYIVIQSRGKWWIDHEGEAKGPYETREIAALEGRALAQMAGHTNHIAEVIVPDSAGKYWVVWTNRAGDTATPRPVSTPPAKSAAAA
jgi:hypothetical protein